MEKIKGKKKMNSHNCTQEARIDLLIEMIKENRKLQEETNKDVKFLIQEHYKQQGKIAIISMMFSGIVSVVAWFFSSHK